VELYRVLVGTGLRIGDLADIRVMDQRLDARSPGIVVPASVDKRRKEGFYYLAQDLVDLLSARVKGRKAKDLLFDVPADLIKRFNGDTKRAGIAKVNDQGRSVDIHSLRKSFGTWLALAGVHPRKLQEMMRHETIEMTMQIDVDLQLFDLFDLSQEVEKLPRLAIGMALV
jgi:integrase